ncbi:hypothetical protein, partial [Streptomyces narbonensis]|uniref:hypothetical protein n=1 Tax=Streptomyces narbonensis TaxID=67333 RepID=UPI001E322F73
TNINLKIWWTINKVKIMSTLAVTSPLLLSTGVSVFEVFGQESRRDYKRRSRPFKYMERIHEKEF